MGIDVTKVLSAVVCDRRPMNGRLFMTWLEDNLEKPGPWNTHDSPKRKINSFLKHKLAMQGQTTIEARRYLDLNDDDTIWCSSVCDRIVPFFEEEVTLWTRK